MSPPPITLTPQLASHAPALFAILSDPALYEHEGSPPESLDWLRERFTRLESRRSADGSEQWLNWVVQLPSGESIGFLHATVYTDQSAELAYTLGSAYWGRGLASEAVRLMIDELVRAHEVHALCAVLKRSNARSHRLLERMGFTLASPERHAEREIDPDEMLMVRSARIESEGAR